MLKPFFKVLSPGEALELFKAFEPLHQESISMCDALFRVLAEPLIAEEDVPGFNRSTMDGIAVRAADTFGASESSPALFTLTGEIAMGELPDMKLKKGEAVRIWTGGALPPNADAVVMIEHVEQIDRTTVEILKSVAPYENVVRKGEDFKAGDVLLPAGHRLRPQDLGMLAAMGKSEVTVYRKPKIAVLSSGDEIVPVHETPRPGCMRDVNRHTISAMITEAHATPVWIGIARDNLPDLASNIDRGLSEADAIVISGGSSMGSRDHVIEAITAYEDSEVLLHGVSISPGKPLILGQVNGKAIIGLPGHPVSAMVCLQQFVVPLMRRLEGETSLGPFLHPCIHAHLRRNVPSKEGRTDFVRVRLEQGNGQLFATPVMGKSGMVSSMVRAHGYFIIQTDCEGLYKGDLVKVYLFSDWMEGSLEKEYLSGHETAGRSACPVLTASQQERLSRI
ncbi:molybdopterin molybdotransferase MoeA [Desulfomonile tiedjei]|uniref:Molybdopterin molybdenumtransferase n=1 Tax=Desulfomonile tiedjei (strain ATCC 49306 / DSM 6799 / DCB-1) TaxID=706587 RepID=I4C2X3_DESTA|nr:gephyrin-like molybdotransferase Glp [Desulfomonile tiedjei]AFM23914.1 molybdopterin molybdochelatase [Desulfomonile tiedjei DSM 6799]